MTAAVPTVDLLAWAALRDAEGTAVAAKAARVTAERRYRYAPVGERQSRLKALREATDRALAADLAVMAAKAQAGGTQ